MDIKEQYVSAVLRNILGVIVLIIIVPSYSLAFQKPIVKGLKCEHLVKPLGVDTPKPRLSWLLKDDRKGAAQTAYRIVMGTDSLAVVNRKGNVWVSGKVNADENLITYQGEPLAPFTKYFWVVDIWDHEHREVKSLHIASFETGMQETTNWKGAWITDNHDIHLKPAAYFRKEFESVKKIKTARVYIAAAGFYELTINGERVGNHRLDPNFTRYDRRALYLTHDITSLLKNGKNAIGVILGNSWYNHQSTAVWFFDQAPWRARPKFCMDVKVTYEDGSIETISTDKTWKTSTGAIIFNSIYTAEHHDARLEQKGWNTINFVDTAWQSASYTPAPTQNVVSQQMHPVRDVKSIDPVSIRKFSNFNYVYNLGQNIAGVSELKVTGEAGTTIRLVHSERLTKEGKADLSNLDYHYRPTDDKDPFQTDIFILSGNGYETFRPKFNYKGFQYIEILSDKPIELTKESLTAYFMHSDVPAIGKIETSNETLNKIWAATNNSYLSNLFGYPTDCPQREKNGWTGDGHIAIETGLYNFDAITVYEKWIADHQDEQQANGVLPAIIPTGVWGYDWANGVDWTSSIAIIPWNIYLFYGDTHLLEEAYDNIKRYVDYIDANSPTGLTDWGLGDWIPIKYVANKELTTSIYFFVDTQILARAAELLGKEKDAVKYLSLSRKIKDAINVKYLNGETGIYAAGLQTELSAPLYWGIVPNDVRSRVAKKLAERVEADEGLDVGLLGSKTILNALSENGYADLAYKLASNEEYPSWGWWIKNGATTLYENWKIEGNTDISLNHIMFGEISAWFYKGLGGIKPDAEQPGFKNVLLEPHFVDSLDRFSANYNGPYGTILSSWKKIGKKITYEVTIPANSTARLILPSNIDVYEGGKPFGIVDKVHGGNSTVKKSLKLLAGTYNFELRYP